MRAQKIEEASSKEHLADSRRRVLDPQSAVHRAGHVVCPDELAHAGRVDSWHALKVQHDASLATTEQCADVMSQLFVNRPAK